MCGILVSFLKKQNQYETDLYYIWHTSERCFLPNSTIPVLCDDTQSYNELTIDGHMIYQFRSIEEEHCIIYFLSTTIVTRSRIDCLYINLFICLCSHFCSLWNFSSSLFLSRINLSSSLRLSPSCLYISLRICSSLCINMKILAMHHGRYA